MREGISTDYRYSCCWDHSECVCVAGLRQILTDVIEEVRESISLDVDGGDVVHRLLNTSWLQSLLKVVHFWVFFFSWILGLRTVPSVILSFFPSVKQACGPGLGCGSDCSWTF